MSRVPNPIRRAILWVGLVLARAGLVDRERAVETTALAWPRVVTGLIHTSKGLADVVMVGIAVGTAGVAGIGFASPFLGVGFAIGGGVAGGTIALVSQRYGAGSTAELGRAVRASVVLVVAVSLPFSTLFWLFPERLLSLVTSNEEVLRRGTRYLQIVGLNIPLMGLNKVGSRTLVGCDDAYTAMQVGATGATVNLLLNTLFIFGFGWGVAGAALGTVLSNLAVASTFTFGLVRGRVPGIGGFPTQVSPFGRYTDRGMCRNLVEIGLPVGLRKLVWVVAAFPMYAILDSYGEHTVAAWVVVRRLTRVMNAPGWGFSLAASSQVGQALGEEDVPKAAAYGRDVIRFAVATYLVSAALVAVFAEQLVVVFAGSSTSPVVPIAQQLVYAACVAVVLGGLSAAASGTLDASGDTRVPFASQFLGMFCVSIPLAYLGATTALGLWGLWFALVAQTGVPAAINYWRFRAGVWKTISRKYRPDAAVADD